MVCNTFRFMPAFWSKQILIGTQITVLLRQDYPNWHTPITVFFSFSWKLLHYIQFISLTVLAKCGYSIFRIFAVWYHKMNSKISVFTDLNCLLNSIPSPCCRLKWKKKRRYNLDTGQVGASFNIRQILLIGIWYHCGG